METNLEASPTVANVAGTADLFGGTDVAAPPPAATAVGTGAADVAGSADASVPAPAADAIGAAFLTALAEEAQTLQNQLGETQLDDDEAQRDSLRESPTPPAREGQVRDALATAGAPQAAVAGAGLQNAEESGAPP